MLRTLVCFILAVIATAAPAHAQIADFSVHGNAYGTYNPSKGVLPVAPTQLRPQTWGKTIENAEWIITVWLDSELVFGAAAVDVTAHYKWTATNKLTGVTSAPASVGTNNFLLAVPGGGLGMRELFPLAPSITWTYAGAIPNGRDGFALAIVEADPVLLSAQIIVHFFELDSTQTPPAWVPAPLRDPVNASQTGFGLSQCPNICGMKDGDIVVVWQDDNPAGTTGAVPGINPIGPTGNPNLLVADIFARRFQQEFPLTAAGPGMVDGAVQFGQGSTVNVTSRAVTYDIWCTAVTDDGEGMLYVTWMSAGSEADDVAGLGANSGPKGGVPNGETWDTYVRRIAVPLGQTGLLPAFATNLTTHGGGGFQPGRIAYNSVLNQIAVIFMDGRTALGLGGNPNLGAVFNTNQTTGAPIVAADVFLAVLDRLTLQPYGMTNVSTDPNPDLSCSVTGFGINGWAVGYTTLDGAVARNTRIEVYALQNGSVSSQSIKRLYPTQAVTNPTQVDCTVFHMGSNNNNSLSISFVHNGGNPDNLRPGEPISLNDPNNGNAPVYDNFIAYGESTTTPPTAGQLSVSRVSVNDDNPIDRAGGGIIPATIEVEIVLTNINGLNPMSITALTLQPPPGFTVVTPPTLPVIIAQSASQTFVVSVATNSALMVPGQNQFDVAATGFIQNAPTVATGKGFVAVTGTQGGLAGVSVSAIINPSVLEMGVPNKATLTITIANAGQFPLVDIALFGTFITGFTPIDAGKITFTPTINSILIPSGGISSFSGEITIGAGVSPRQYRPAFTVGMRQQANIGSVTVMLANEMSLLPNPFGGLPAGEAGLVNRGGGGVGAVEGCTLSETGDLPWFLMALAGLLAAAWVVRRRMA